jgi:hypothetical protein
LADGVSCTVLVEVPGRPVQRSMFVAAPVAERAAPTVVQVYPSAAELPANQLKFYIHFSAPMRQGEAWNHVRLLDDQGKVVELAFLEIDQELWDRDAQRLTVLFDPGRIKRGVLPREQGGGALTPGQRYTLEIDGAWKDAAGTPLGVPFRKAFVAVAEDRTPIDPSRWKLTLPKAGTREPLIVDAGEPLDAALLERLVTLPGVAGAVSLGREEREWRLTPDAPWPAGAYELRVDTALEDLAGNKVGRPFDVDQFERITVRTGRGTVAVAFRVGG